MRTALAVLVVAMVAGVSMFAVAEGDNEPVTIKGEIVDLACWLEDGKSGPEHAKCAKSCVQGGSPAGLLAEDGQIYLIVVHGKEGKSPLSHVAEKVEVTGIVHERGGIKGITATVCKKIAEDAPKKGEGSGGR